MSIYTAVLQLLTFLILLQQSLQHRWSPPQCLLPAFTMSPGNHHMLKADADISVQPIGGAGTFGTPRQSRYNCTFNTSNPPKPLSKTSGDLPVRPANDYKSCLCLTFSFHVTPAPYYHGCHAVPAQRSHCRSSRPGCSKACALPTCAAWMRY